MKTYSFTLEGISKDETYQTVEVTRKNAKLYDMSVNLRISPDRTLSISTNYYGFTWKQLEDCLRYFNLNEKVYLKCPRTVKGKLISIKRIYNKLKHLKIDDSFNFSIYNHSIILKKTSKSENLIDKLEKRDY